MKIVRPTGSRLDGRLNFVTVAGIACLLLLPTLVSAQGNAAIGGTATDTTGGVLPGVTVEVRSPALIEQVRTAVTDGTGQYLVVALPSGSYTVTFTLPGFSTLVREGVELTGGFTANITVELAVGTLAETVTVTDASPTIDVQNVRQSEVIDRDIFEVLPTQRQHDSLALLIPAMNLEAGPTGALSIDTGGIGGEGNNRLMIHGSVEEDAEVHVDGLDIGMVAMEGAPQGTPFDAGVAEYVYDYSGNSAEVETGGVRLNMIPREGGNEFSGGFFTGFAHPSWLMNNVSQELIDRGIQGGEAGGVGMDQSWQVAPTIGGPIVQDKLWFFASYAFRRGSVLPANLFNSEDTSALSYVPDLDNPTIDRTDIYEGSMRLTWQASSKDKVQWYWANNHSSQNPSLTGSQLFPIFIAPEAGSNLVTSPNNYQLKWTRPQTNRILFEMAVGMQPSHNLLIDMSETGVHGNCRGDCSAFGTNSTIPSAFEFIGLTMSRNMGFFFGGTDRHFQTTNTMVRGSMSYVTGSHNLKVGFSTNGKSQTESSTSNNNWTNMATLFGSPVQAYFENIPPETNELFNVGVYAQDQWTIDRFTVNAGVRFDYFDGSYPDHNSPAGVWAPANSFSGFSAVTWKDLQPRLGVVYDLRGDGRTALKATASRFGSRDAIGLSSEFNPAGNNTRQTRTWLDGAVCFDPAVCIPGDGLPQGDPLNPANNGELFAGGNPAFGTPIITAFSDPEWAYGWGKKHSNWEFSGSLQHELLSGVSMDVGYFRRRYINFETWDNRAVGPEDFDTYTIIVPEDPRLPDGGGYPLTLVDMKPEAFGRVQNNFTTDANRLGGETETWQGVDVNLSARLDALLVQGGFATGKRVNDLCGVRESVPEIFFGSPSTFAASRLEGTAGSEGSVIANEHCDINENWLTNVSVFGAYTFPYDIDLSFALFSRPGVPRKAIYLVPADVIVAALGRPSSQPSTSLDVIAPGTEFGDRLTQLDFRVGKVFDLAAAGNFRASFDIYNLFNGNAVGREQAGITPGASGSDQYLTPLGLQPGRLFKVSLQYNF